MGSRTVFKDPFNISNRKYYMASYLTMKMPRLETVLETSIMKHSHIDYVFKNSKYVYKSGHKISAIIYININIQLLILIFGYESISKHLLDEMSRS